MLPKTNLQTSSIHHLPLLVGGDFNLVLSPQEDKSLGSRSSRVSPSQPPTPLHHFADGLHLVDPRSLSHPEGRQYTFSSLPHNTLSRIDYTFSNSTLLKHITYLRIYDIAISDHAPISVDLTGPSQNLAFPVLFGTQPRSSRDHSGNIGRLRSY